jgi:VanZ family protein
MINKVVFFLYTLLVGFVSLKPPGPVSPGSYDKLAHFAVYGFFAYLAYRLHLAGRGYLYACVGIVLYSGLLEFGQSFVPGRQMSSLDLLANTLGVILGALLCRKLYDYSKNVT